MASRHALCLVFIGAILPPLPAGAADLSARLVDPEWDGKTVPKEHVCKLAGGARPMSPRIEVTNLPTGTTKIVVAFNDESYQRLAIDGGHGKISVEVPRDAKRVMFPPVPSEDETIPAGIKVEAKHRSTTPGYYLAPCSRGRGHVYAAEIIAVKGGLFGSSDLAKVRLPIGIY